MGSDSLTPSGDTPDTSWSMIIAAKGDTARSRDALERFCRLYWPPLYAYARRRGLESADAEDATQEFFTKVIAQNWLAQVDANKGRFRGFLFQSMSFHLSDARKHRAAQKRGGGVPHVPLEIAAEEERFNRVGAGLADPASCFDYTWACTVLDLALERLTAEEKAAGRPERLDALRPFLTAPPTAGDYERLAHQLGLAKPTVAVLVHRLGKRYRELIRAVVSDTLADPADIDSELRHLLLSFSSSPAAT